MPLKPPVSSTAKKTIKIAFEKLEKTILPEDSHDFSTTTIDDVKKAALVLEDQLAARNSLRNMRRLLPLLAGLEHYAKVMDILCNGTPYLPWIWAPITLVIRIASEYIEAFEKIIKGYSRIAESLGRFKTLQTALGADRDFQETLAVFYSNILQYHEHAYTFVRRKSWRLLFVTSWGRFERRFDNILDDMKRHEELVDLQASAHGISDIRQMRDEIKSWREESHAQVRKWHEKQAFKQYDSIVSWLKSEESDQLAILESISSEGAKFAGTCSWVLSNARIKAWLGRVSDTSVLWLQGTPGSGKSVLVSQVVKFMKNANMSLLYHFCSQRYASSTTYEQVLRSILLQLLRKDDELIAHVYEDCILGKRSPTIQSLEKLLYSLFSVSSRGPRQSEYIWVIIDGLNECDSRTQSSVANLINQMTNRLSGTGDTICKILVSSRKSPHIANRLKMKQKISLTEERYNIKLAMRQYVSQRLRAMHEKLAQLELTRKDIDDIERVITNKADGMFLYARLVLDYLSKNLFFSGKEMKKSIDELPDELYRKLLIQILVQLDQRSVERIKSIFSWIAFSKRPMKRMEFLSALSFSYGDTEVTSLVPRYVLDICGALVEERSDTTLTFIHISVKDFLQSSLSNVVISEPEAIAEQCLSTLACLMCGSEVFLGDRSHHIKASRVVKGIHGFHVYATEFWTEYLLHHVSTRSSSANSTILDLASRLAERLNGLTNTDSVQDEAPNTYPVDERIQFLGKWPQLCNLVETSLRARSLKRLECNLKHELQHTNVADNGTGLETKVSAHGKRRNSGIALQESNAMSLMLSSYQDIVRFLLQQDEYPGISADDLYLFKSQFQSSAYTCRLSFCPRATNGFESEELRRQHEIAHTQLCICTVPECRYPPFASIGALRTHINKYHRPEKRVRPIKRTGSSSLRQRFLDTGMKSGIQGHPYRKNPTDVLANLEYGGAAVAREAPKSLRDRHETNKTTKAANENTSREHPPSSDANMLESDGNDVLNWDEILQVPIESIGYRGCAITNCGFGFGAGSGKEPAGNGIPTLISFHYWNWHHADSMSQCAVAGCQMVFSSNQGLQAHYEQRHTALFCGTCDANHPDGFAFEEELRHHWRSNHLVLVKGWVCDDPGQEIRKWPVALRYDSCQSCTEGRRYDRRYDAIKHLASQHFKAAGNMADKGLIRLLESHVHIVQAYEPVKKEEGLKHGQDNISNNGLSDDEEIVVDDMFFVKELA
ncbi:hypothetical protein BFJ70_g14981 [Fusarium oxysporum]|nr:hypothetical protein BFJ70_g14981 [Fusarium oxysporum]